jgi:hypothetical protein
MAVTGPNRIAIDALGCEFIAKPTFNHVVLTHHSITEFNKVWDEQVQHQCDAADSAPKPNGAI